MRNLWSESEAQGKNELDTLVYQSRLIGADTSLVVWGGGNTSIKSTVKDFRGRHVEALVVKGSGSDMKSIERKHFPSLRLDDTLALFDRDAMTDDEMVEYLGMCMLDPKAPRPSIETLLHAFLPFNSVAHSHADAIVSLTNTRECLDILKAVYGKKVSWVEYIRPGFKLSKLVGQTVKANPKVDGIILINHGLFTWGGDARQTYDRHIDIVTKAEEYIVSKSRGKAVFNVVKSRALPDDRRRALAAALAPTLRGAVSRKQGVVLRYDDAADILEFVNSKEAAELSQIGPATPDHTLQTKIKPMWVELDNPDDIEASKKQIKAAADQYADDYAAWYQANTDNKHPMLDPYPRVILAPGLGMWSTGKDARAALIAGDIYHHTISVLKSASAIGHYSSLSDKDSYDVEYWPMELYKLTLLPPDRELSRKVALVTGAASGIGLGIARRLAADGAHVFLTDIDADGVHKLAEELNKKHGYNRAAACVMDVTNEENVADAFRQLRLAYGGLDVLVSNAGIASAGAVHDLPLKDWQRSFDVNATGHFLVSREAVRLMRQQGMGGSIVFIGTRNITSPGNDFSAYSASKAAEAQLGKVIALENASHGIRCNIINPDAVFEGSKLWSRDIMEQRAKTHGTTVEKLPDFYRQRNMLKVQITPADVAEIVVLFAGSRAAKTTGAMFPLDGGIKDAFVR
ncbi:MAG: bifunctional rhamnulose-1-phosphate aldolase/short-chain dehydrogenase [SAR202 cluster bacterium]|nr:bifunctional rhamnulose-1-phosphate aldolase/short-chain dehydrogenase [SAR202 cluster bacterium]